ERADSITFDPHKRLGVGLPLGMILFKRKSDQNFIKSNAQVPYLFHKKDPKEKTPESESSYDLGNHSIAGSRPFMSLKLWFALQLLGKKGYETWIDYTINLTKTIAQKIKTSRKFELMAEPSIDQLSFRFAPDSFKERIQTLQERGDLQELNKINGYLNGLNLRIQEKLEKSRQWYFGDTQLRSTVYATKDHPEFEQNNNIRSFLTAFINPFITEDMLDEVLGKIQRLGEKMYKEDGKPWSDQAMKAEDWHRLALDWKKRYQALRESILNIKGLNNKLDILRKIHVNEANLEIARIEKIEQEESDKPKKGKLIPILPRSKAWDVDLSEDEVPLWNETEIAKYYYHGTSLGIARVWAMRGFIGGIKGLSSFIDIDKIYANENKQEEVFLTDSTHSKIHSKDLTALPETIYETDDYALRTKRPGRAILIYYALREIWEKEKRQEPFPPIKDFLQRIILRIPKNIVKGVTGSVEWSKQYTSIPISIKGVELLLDQDIPLPNSSYQYLENLSGTDPEKLSESIGPKGSIRYARMQELVSEMGRVLDLENAIGNAVIDKWKPIQSILPMMEKKEDRAMLSSSSTMARFLILGKDSEMAPLVESKTDVGGINLNNVAESLQIQNSSTEIKFHIDPAQLAQLQAAPGLYPVIINIQPMTDIRGFLGLNDAGRSIVSA
ncbi:MAG: hypothetical protein HQL15_10720, partial [Candidatus Omnitrophica bacterium]|nr:hypothetical protein [Candidatus Omnitrophota bacterium]